MQYKHEYYGYTKMQGTPTNKTKITNKLVPAGMVYNHICTRRLDFMHVHVPGFAGVVLLLSANSNGE